jgi:hypothetical protein
MKSQDGLVECLPIFFGDIKDSQVSFIATESTIILGVDGSEVLFTSAELLALGELVDEGYQLKGNNGRYPGSTQVIEECSDAPNKRFELLLEEDLTVLVSIEDKDTDSILFAATAETFASLRDLMNIMWGMVEMTVIEVLNEVDGDGEIGIS